VNTEPNVKWTLSIWREFTPATRLVLLEEESSKILDADSPLQEEVYSWRMCEDAFGGIPDDAMRRELYDLLVNSLNASRAPSERAVSVLADFVGKAESLILENLVSWTPSQGQPEDENQGFEADPVRMNSLLALLIHLKWVVSVFQHQPGISVLVR